MGFHCNAYVPVPKFLFEWFGIIVSFSSLVPLIVALSTEKWLACQVKTSNNKTIDYENGLWTYCMYENCVKSKCDAIIDITDIIKSKEGDTINYLGGVLVLLGAVCNTVVFIMECRFLTYADTFLLNYMSIISTAVALVFVALGLTMYVNQAGKVMKIMSYNYSFWLACFTMVLLIVLLLIGILRAQGKKPDNNDERGDEKIQVYWKEIVLVIMFLVSIITFILSVVALSTNFWLRHKTTNQCEQYYYGLWQYCFYKHSNKISCDNLQNIPKDFMLTNNNNPRYPILLATVLHFIHLPSFYFLFKNRFVKIVVIAVVTFSITSFILSVTGISVFSNRWKNSKLTHNWEYSYVFCWMATFGYLLIAILCILFWFAPEKPTEIRKATLSISRRKKSIRNSHQLPEVTEPEFTIPTYIIDPYDITDSPNMVHKQEVAERAKERADREEEERNMGVVNEAEQISEYILEMVKEIEETSNVT